MYYINTKDELKDYIFRRLGSESFQIEISDKNWDDIFNASINFMFERSDDAVNRKLAIIETDSKEFFLNNNVMSISRISGPNLISTSITTYAYAGISPLYDLLRGDIYDTSTFLIMTERIKEYQKLFNEKIDFSFNTHSKRLNILSPIKKMFMIDYFCVEDENLLYENELLLKYIEMLSWRTWAMNVGSKYVGSTIGNGVTINFNHMMDMYRELKQDIENDIVNETYDMLLPRPIR